MYIKLRNTAQAQLQLNMLDNLAEESGNPALTEELLYTKTDYFYIFEQKKEGDAAFNKLISQYREKKEYGKSNECYQNLIAIARKANNISLLEQTYEKYMVWTDSVKNAYRRGQNWVPCNKNTTAACKRYRKKKTSYQPSSISSPGSAR